MLKTSFSKKIWRNLIQDWQKDAIYSRLVATLPLRPQNLHSALFSQVSLETPLGILTVKLLPHLLQLALTEYDISIITIETAYLSFLRSKLGLVFLYYLTRSKNMKNLISIKSESWSKFIKIAYFASFSYIICLWITPCRGIEARPTEKDSRSWQWEILSLRGSGVQIPPPASLSSFSVFLIVVSYLVHQSLDAFPHIDWLIFSQKFFVFMQFQNSLQKDKEPEMWIRLT